MRALWLTLALAACGADPEPTDETADTGGEEAGLIGADVPWPDKTPEEKHSWMTHRVKPRMIELFTEFDPTYADTFDCGTCHGENTNVSDYGTMPHPDGPPALSQADWPTQSTDPDIRAIATFMEEVVEPEFATLIDSQVSMFGGVSCRTCHEIQ
ncbi:MAG: hypothetical protein EP330_24750 [Deltaproteobacteria bacterium]|nr:MAG: hypothetical protein EP330_24750 [Deltaproteobacteria bacterium]